MPFNALIRTRQPNKKSSKRVLLTQDDPARHADKSGDNHHCHVESTLRRPPSRQLSAPYAYHDDSLRLPPLNRHGPTGAGYYQPPDAPTAAGQQPQSQWAPTEHSFPMPGSSQYMPRTGPAGPFLYGARPTQHGMVHDATRHGPHAPISEAFQGHNTNSSQFALRPVDTRMQAAHPSASQAVNAQPSSSRVRLDDIPIDPRLIPLPGHDGDKDLQDNNTIAEATGHAAAAKVAGSRRKGKQRADEPGSERRVDKGKRHADAAPQPRKRVRLDDEDQDDEQKTAKRGRPHGAGNYSQDDLGALLDYVEGELPLGQRGWERIHRRFVKWAHRHGRPERALKSLETKYKQLVKTKKPTGNGVCPPSVDRAHAIEDLINDRAGTRDLADSDFDDAGNAGGDINEQSDNADRSSDEDGPVPALLRPRRAAVTATVVRAPIPSHHPTESSGQLQSITPRHRANAATDLVSRISQVFDPDIQVARDTERHSCSLQHTEFFSVHQQLRDALAANESYRNTISDLRDRLHAAESARDRAEMRLEISQATAGDHHGRSRERSPRHHYFSSTRRPLHRSTSRHSRHSHHSHSRRSHSPRSHRPSSALQHLDPMALDTPTRRRLYKATGRQEYKTKRRHIVRYPEGGEASMWITDESADENGNPIILPSVQDLWPSSPPRPMAASPAPARADDAALEDGDNPISDWEMTPPPQDDT
ncbi:hypothetical protein EWM64_g3611 [Hericium alpestre]|uniref:DUF6818 domain-containing protein n=1 Tax=Hericium alpestre TaxID=135208 RepID=A0A4Z0A3F3_9AGAM|nr:hypothetical protein EWM64_g3611 [Hericium alpestre]